MKKVVLVLVAVFLGFWMFTNPHSLAETSQSAGAQTIDLTGDFFEAVIRFVGELGQ
jgi:hypothetical protein